MTDTWTTRKQLTVPKYGSVRHFCELMAFAATLEEPKLKFTITEKEVYEIEDVEKWREWRKTKTMPSASMIASLLGVGYRSFNMEFKEMVGISKRAEQSGFSKRMMDHGTNFEPATRQAYCDFYKSETFKLLESGTKSRIMSICDGNNEWDCLVTPDMLVSNDSHPDVIGKRIVELKCPAYGIVTVKRPINDVVKNFTELYPQGRANHFLQAAMYAIIFQVERFDLFYFFTDGTTEWFFNVRFIVTEPLKKLIYESIQSCWRHIEKYQQEKKHDYPIIKDKKVHIQRIQNIMKESHWDDIIKCVTSDELVQKEIDVLEEDSSDESE